MASSLDPRPASPPTSGNRTRRGEAFRLGRPGVSLRASEGPWEFLTGPGIRLRDDRTMNDELPVEVFLERFPPAIRETGLRLRELIRIAVPDAVEGVRSGWSWIGYGLPDR